MASKRETSVEPRVEEKATGWLSKYGIQYWLKSESMNSEIDNALKDALSKLGGSGGNIPDIKCFIDYKGRKIPVMIEAKGYKSSLEKLNDMGEIDNYTKKDLPNYQNINKYAVNGAVHYATAIVNLTKSYKEVIAIGITGWKEAKMIETSLKVYYVSDENYNVPKQVGEYKDLSFLADSELEEFVEKIDSLYLTEDERELLTQKLEAKIETNLKNLNQAMRDTYSISEAYRVKLISGMIIAGLGVVEDDKTIVAPLEIDDLKSKQDKRNHDGFQIMNTISAYLDSKDIPQEKVELIKTNFEQVFIQTDLYKEYQPGESRLKKVYITVKKDIVPFFTKQKYHLDFTGKLFNVLNDWVKVPDGDQNDVVLTPRYVCDLMVRLCQVNKNSYVWDYAAGSGGFLVASMKAMIKEANQIKDKEERDRTINSIKMKQLLGVELRPDMYSLAVLNMFLMGDGSTHILCDDSLKNYSGKYEQGDDKDDDFPADVFLLNPPYSADGKGFNFVKLALSRMKGGYAAVLIQENAGSGAGGSYSRDILDKNTLIASIKMGDIFCGRSSVQTAIYVFEVGHTHPEKKKVKFIDFTNDGYTRQSRRRSSQEVNLRDTDNAIARYSEIVDIVLDCEPDTSYYTIDNGLLITDTITTRNALKEPQKKLEKVHERIDPLRIKKTNLNSELRDKTKLLKNAKEVSEKNLLEDEITSLNKTIVELTKKINKIEPELAEAQKNYDDIFNKIGADWTYAQHKQIDTIPNKEAFESTIADYLSWKISQAIKEGVL